MSKSLRVLVAAATLWVSATAGMASAAAASSAPWTDPNQVGYIGFCDANNHQIYSGSVGAYPFVVKAVSSAPAPTHYGPPYGHATLFVYQPIQYVDPGNWSGKQMSGASVFTNGSAPMIQGVPADPSLLNFIQAYTLHWDGYAQFRFYYTTLGYTLFSSTYPAATVQVTGDTWTQVGGGPVNCAAGQVASRERDLPLAEHSQGPAGSPTKGASGGASGSASSGAAGGGNPDSSTTAGSGAAAASSKGKGSGGGAVAAVIAVAALASIGAVYFVRRRFGRVG